MTEQIGQGLNEEDLIDGGKVMSLFDHLGELRSVFVKSALFVLLLFFVSLGFAEHLIDFLKQPLLDALPETATNDLYFTGLLDVFLASIKVSFLTAIVGGSPVWLYQFWSFFKPGLYPSERKYIFPFIVASVGLFLTGVSFCFFIILPMAINFLLALGQDVGIPIITINDYLSFVMVLIFGFGLVFETPLILVLLAMLDLITAEMLQEYRRFVLIVIMVMGALLTPPDPISQLAMAVPVYFMYEISIVIIRIIKRPKKATHAVT